MLSSAGSRTGIVSRSRVQASPFPRVAVCSLFSFYGNLQLPFSVIAITLFRCSAAIFIPRIASRRDLELFLSPLPPPSFFSLSLSSSYVYIPRILRIDATFSPVLALIRFILVIPFRCFSRRFLPAFCSPIRSCFFIAECSFLSLPLPCTLILPILPL